MHRISTPGRTAYRQCIARFDSLFVRAMPH